ncbi:MAG: EVE domain-containing protein [Candidatus Latescibacteria bacterium]|mgnify:FL=1|jgi:predicted RNA-binding protein with PUA-like domain|nr:EVE domain-containing protein [Candidatus Latescibacterota bacterium]
MNYWLVKCEYDECTFDELKTRPQQTGRWRGVRNYQARNFIRDVMQKGDLAFFYQSNCAEPGSSGVVKVVKAGYPDPSQFDPEHKYYDEKSTKDEPRWFTFDVKQHKAFKSFVHLKDLKNNNALKDMKVVQRGQRLSIQPVTPEEFEIVCEMGGI